MTICQSFWRVIKSDYMNKTYSNCKCIMVTTILYMASIKSSAFWIYFPHEHPTDNKSTLIQLSTLLMLATKYLAFGINTIPADALAPKVSNGSAGMLLAV